MEIENIEGAEGEDAAEVFGEFEIPGDIDVLIIGRGKFYKIESEYPGSFKAFSFGLQDEAKWNDALLVMGDSDITSLEQLEGKIIGVAGDPAAGVRGEGLRNMLKKNGLDPNNFTIVGAFAWDLMIGEVDALELREPELSLMLQGGVARILVDGPIFAGNIFSPWPMSAFGVSSKFIEENPETVEKIIRIWDQAINFIERNPNEVDRITRKCMEENFSGEGVGVNQLQYWKNDGIDKDLIQRQLDFYYETSGIKKIDVNDIILIY